MSVGTNPRTSRWRRDGKDQAEDGAVTRICSASVASMIRLKTRRVKVWEARLSTASSTVSLFVTMCTVTSRHAQGVNAGNPGLHPFR